MFIAGVGECQEFLDLLDYGNVLIVHGLVPFRIEIAGNFTMMGAVVVFTEFGLLNWSLICESSMNFLLVKYTLFCINVRYYSELHHIRQHDEDFEIYLKSCCSVVYVQNHGCDAGTLRCKTMKIHT